VQEIVRHRVGDADTHRAGYRGAGRPWFANSLGYRRHYVASMLQDTVALPRQRDTARIALEQAHPQCPLSNCCTAAVTADRWRICKASAGAK
jgi:hypothetical protein